MLTVMAYVKDVTSTEASPPPPTDRGSNGVSNELGKFDHDENTHS